MLLKDNVILITGAGRGLGRGIAQAAVEAGARVALTDLDVATVEETATPVDPEGKRDGEDPEEVLARIVPHQLGRHIEPIEVGRVIAFLLSEQAVIIRGQAINVDGGDTPY